MIVHKVQVLKTKGGRYSGWYWRLVARNGKILAHSETYADYRNAMNTASEIYVGFIASHGNRDVSLVGRYNPIQ